MFICLSSVIPCEYVLMVYPCGSVQLTGSNKVYHLIMSLRLIVNTRIGIKKAEIFRSAGRSYRIAGEIAHTVKRSSSAFAQSRHIRGESLLLACSIDDTINAAAVFLNEGRQGFFILVVQKFLYSGAERGLTARGIANHGYGRPLYGSADIPFPPEPTTITRSPGFTPMRLTHDRFSLQVIIIVASIGLIIPSGIT